MNPKMKKFIVGTAIASTVFTSALIPTFANNTSHRVVSGDTLWKIAQRYEVSLEDIYGANPHYRSNPSLMVGDTVNIPSQGQTTYTVLRNDTPWIISNKFGVNVNDFLRANNLREGQHIYVGQRVVIPGKTNTSSTYAVQRNDTPWTISNKFGISMSNFLSANGLKSGDYIYPGQKVTIPSGNKINTPSTSTNSSTPTKIYKTYSVQRGDNLWNIAIKHGIPYQELLKTNRLNESSIVQIGQKLTIPVYNIPVKPTPGPQYGELLDWWTEAQYVLPINKVFTVQDFYTGKRWQMKRTIGANHADVEPLTAKDAAIMKEVWSGNWSWNTRPIIVEVDGRRLAASANGMPHGVQYIKNNNFNGHICIHFSRSTLHRNGQENERHQQNVLIAAGKSK
ncbi:MAG: LysM peptidoglycan-binding domain-containing protein [Clostridiaceae bacterium]|nr:LysM peptidoglycan-binding domain-containing protein [Clostridiaceae bacterium]